MQLQRLLSLTIVALGVMLPAQAVDFPNAGDRGAPSRTTGGGTRGEWCEGNSLWTNWDARALVPINNVSTFSEKQAMLWLHVGENFDGRTAEIYVKDVTTNESVYEQQMTLEGLEQDSLVTVTLPELTEGNAALIETGKDYLWEFSIICDANNRANDYVMQGLFHRVEKDEALTMTLAEATPSQQIEQYASAGLWQETLQAAVSLRESQPQLWAKLLASVELEDLTPGERFSTRGASSGPSSIPAPPNE